MTTTQGLRRMVLATLLVTLTAVLTACGGAAKPTAPAPAPAPTTAPAAPTAPAVAAAPAFEQLIIGHDVVRGATNVPQEKRGDLVCVQASRFARNERVVWRIRVMDPRTGAFLTDKEVGLVEVKLKDGQVLTAKYAPHGKAPDPVESFWTAGWTIPANYPSGTAPFTISAKANDGRGGMNMPDFKVPAAFLTVLDSAVPVIPPAPKK